MVQKLALIDAHQHFLPPAYVESERERVLAAAPMMPASFTDWSPERAIEGMDAAGVAAAICSISTPGVWTGNVSRARALSRACNDYGAEMVARYPGRFGILAALPLPDVTFSLVEADRALGDLELEGVALMTNYDGRWLGDPAFAPVFEELDRRGAVVFVHPTATEHLPAVPDVPPSLIEYPQDTARTILSLLFSGSLTRFRNIKFVFAHGAGTLPMVWMRIEGALGRERMRHVRARLPNGAAFELRRQYYDLTNVVGPSGYAAVRAFASDSQLLFGTDYPYWSPDWCADTFRAIPQDAELTEQIGRSNALALFPRLASVQ